MKKYFILLLYSFIFFSAVSPAQTKKKAKDESFMDKVQKIIGIRRSFAVSSETTKPGVLSFKKDNNENAVFNIDIAFMYKGFRYDDWRFTPSIQFDYSSKPKDQLEKLKAGFDVDYKIYEYSGGYGKIEPAVSYANDFYNKIREFQTSFSFIPRFPNLFIPIQNVSDVKFMYDGNDNRWVFGFNPIIGTNYRNTYSDVNDIDDKEYFASFAGSFSLKRYYILFEIYGKYEEPLNRNYAAAYKYDAAAVFYFDSKERSSLNLRVEQEDARNKRNRKFTVGFGIKL